MKKLTQLCILMTICVLIATFQNCAKTDLAVESAPINPSVQNQSELKLSLSFLKKPTALTNSRNAFFELSVTSKENVTIDNLEYNLNNSGWTQSQFTIDVPNVTVGNNSIEVRAVRNLSVYSESIKYFWFVDDEKPEVRLTLVPPQISSSAQANFAFVTRELLTVISETKCILDDVIIEACESPFQTPVLSNGRHQFSVQVTDNAGNVSNVEIYNFEYVPQVKSLSLLEFPNSIVNTRSAQFTFQQTGQGNDLVNYKCRLDDTTFVNCTQPVFYEALSEGTHQFQIKGSDIYGNETAVIAMNWSVDLTPPSFHLESPANALIDNGTPVDMTQLGTSQPVLSFTTSDSHGVKKVECSFSSTGNFESCQSPIDRRQQDNDGEIKNYRVRITDNAGNVELKSLWFRTPLLQIPFITLNFAGGIGFNGNMIVLDSGKELLPSYSKMGLGDSPYLNISMNYGMAWNANSGILAGIKKHVPDSHNSKIHFFAIANRSVPDTSENKLYAGGAIQLLGLKGKYLNALGTIDSDTGISQQNIWSSTTQAQIIRTIDNYPKIEGVSFNPLDDLDFKKLFLLTHTYDADWVMASLVYNSLNGQAGPVGINFGGYDYHNGNKALQDFYDTMAGERIGKTIELAILKNKRLVLNLTTDGGNYTPESSIPGGAWTGDRPDNVQIFVIVDPTETVAIDTSSSGNYMIGAYNRGQTVDKNSVAYDNPAKAAAIVVCNYLFFAGGSDCSKEINHILTDEEIQKIKVVNK